MRVLRFVLLHGRWIEAEGVTGRAEEPVTVGASVVVIRRKGALRCQWTRKERELVHLWFAHSKSVKNGMQRTKRLHAAKKNQVTVYGLRACDFLTVSAAAASISLPYRLASYVLLAKKTSEVIFNVLI